MKGSSSLLIEQLPLTEADLEAFARCGITEATLRASGVFRVSSAEGARLVGRRSSSGDYGGVVFPYRWPGEEWVREYRLRLDHPPYELLADGRCKAQSADKRLLQG